MANNTERKTIEVIIKGQQPVASIKEMESAARVLNAQLKKLPANSAEFAEKSKELRAINKRLQDIKNDVKGVGGVFQQISKEVKAFGLVAIAALGFSYITSGVNKLIAQNATLSDSLADIRKTTGLTDIEAKRLNNTFSQMNTRTATRELRDMAIAAGQLGIAKRDIFSFTSATDKLVVALGDEFQGGAAQVTKEMGALRNIFSDIKTDKIADDMLHIGNAINELASDGAATGPVISDFSNRIGGVGIPLGLTSGQVLGLSASLQELNVNTERGGTAITKILLKMTQETDKFAKVAGMSTQDFTRMVNKDLYGAFLKVVEGSKKSATSATEFSKILDSLGVDGSGASEVFSKLGSNTALLKEKVDLANVSLKGTDSIMNEFNIKNETFGAKVDKISKSLTSAFVNGPVMAAMNSLADSLVKLTINTHAVSEAMAEEQQELELNKIKILSYNVGNEERTKLLNELKEQYPEYLANLDAEKSSNDAVREAIDQVINSLVNRIIVQRKQEDLAEQAESIADKKEKQLSTERKLMEALNIAYKDNEGARRNAGNSQVKWMSKENEGLPIMVAAQALLDEKNSGLSRMNPNIIAVADALENMKKAEIALNSEVMKGNDIQREKDELMKRLGVNPGKSNDKGTNAATDPRVSAEITANEEITKERKRLQEKIAELEIEFYQKGLDSDIKEINEVHEKYKKLLKEEGVYGEEKMRIQKLYTKEVEAIIEKQAKEEQKRNADKLASLQKLQDEVYMATLSANDRELVAEMNKWDELILKAEEAGIDVISLRQAEADAINAIVVAQAQKEIDEAERAKGKKVKLEKEKNELLKRAFRDFTRNIESIQANMETVQQNREAAELRRNDQNLTTQENRFNYLLKSKAISQQEYDDLMIEAKKKHDEKETEINKQAYDRQQRAAITSALINGAVGITKIWSTWADYPLVAAGLTIVEVAAIGAQIAAIESTPKPYAKGGFNESDDPQGWTNGPTWYTGSATGTDFIAGEEGREWIAPNWMVESPETAPIIRHLETIRANRSFAAGGSTSVSSSTPKPVFKESNNTSKGDELQLLRVEIKRLNDHLDKGIIGKWDWDYFNESLKRAQDAESAARVG